MEYQKRKSALTKTGQLLTVAVFMFLLGRFSVGSSLSGWGWAAVAFGGAALTGSLFLLLRDFWKSNA
jgi:hypothetical protein